MGRKRHTPEQIIRRLREAEVELAKGQTTGDITRSSGSLSRPITGGARSTGASDSTRRSA